MLERPSENKIQPYLDSSQFIDWHSSAVHAKAKELALGAKKQEDIALSCFVFVRDQIKHSMDYKLNPITSKASDVLKHGTGFCYAKSHLLAALLRVNGIPTGLCYQRLTIKNDQAPFSLHGLNAIYLEDYGWYRIDARGNKQGINAQFCPPIEKLAFPIVTEGEHDLPEIWPEPLSCIIEALSNNHSYSELAMNLPDIVLNSPASISTESNFYKASDND